MKENFGGEQLGRVQGVAQFISVPASAIGPIVRCFSFGNSGGCRVYSAQDGNQHGLAEML